MVGHSPFWVRDKKKPIPFRIVDVFFVTSEVLQVEVGGLLSLYRFMYIYIYAHISTYKPSKTY